MRSIADYARGEMHGDLARLATAIDTVAGSEAPADFGAAALEATLTLIPGDVTSYNEVFRSGEVEVLAAPSQSDYHADLIAAFAAHIHENPLLGHYRRTGRTEALRFSDVVSGRELPRLPLYQLCYRHIGVEEQVAVTLPTRDGLIGITVSRTDKDFTEDERRLLEVAARSFGLARRALVDRIRMRAALAALESVAPDSGVALVDEDGRILGE